MPDNLLHIGQWRGYFRYGAEYGELIAGQEAEFRLFIESFESGQFGGKVIDWQGYGAEGEVSALTGFIDDGFISFTKRYGHHIAMDENGTMYNDEHRNGHCVHYEGQYDSGQQAFTGIWEIYDEAPDGVAQDSGIWGSGTWRMPLR